MKFFVCFVAATCLAQISAPLIGYMRDRSNALRPVHGLAGVFVTGPAVEHDVLSAAWSGSTGLAKTARELLVLDVSGVVRREAAPSGAATFGFLRNGDPAWVRFADGSCRSFGAECPADTPHKTLIRHSVAQVVTLVEQFGGGWLIARTRDRLYAVRQSANFDEVFELPEEDR